MFHSGTPAPNGAVQTRDPPARGARAPPRRRLAPVAAARPHRLPAVPRALAALAAALRRPSRPTPARHKIIHAEQLQYTNCG